MPVSAYVIRCASADQTEVLRQLREIAGIQIGEPTGGGIPIATESETTREASELGERLQTLRGIQSAVLVYHNFEDLAEAGLPVA